MRWRVVGSMVMSLQQQQQQYRQAARRQKSLWGQWIGGLGGVVPRKRPMWQCWPTAARMATTPTRRPTGPLSSRLDSACFGWWGSSNGGSIRQEGFLWSAALEDVEEEDGQDTISFLTDVEGDASYLRRFVEYSKVLEWESVEPTLPLVLKDGGVHRLDETCEYFPYQERIVFTEHNKTTTHLVYGGDIWDRGGNDLYVIRQLLSLKKRYPTRVHLVMGNRDINKMRIWSEVVSCQRHGGVYWLRHSGRVGDPAGGGKAAVPSDRAACLQWMLKNTMGSPHAFEYRRQELLQERQFVLRHLRRRRPPQGEEEDGSEAPISQIQIGLDLYDLTDEKESLLEAVKDTDVVESYLHSCHATRGEMGQYLHFAKLVVDNFCGPNHGILFLHGALPNVVNDDPLKFGGKSTATLPPPSEDTPIALADPTTSLFWSHYTRDFAKPFETTNATQELQDDNDDKTPSPRMGIRHWIQDLNAFSSRQVLNWQAQAQAQAQEEEEEESCLWATTGGYTHANGGEDLRQYGMGWLPDNSKNPTVVYSTWFRDGLPKSNLTLVREFMQRGSIQWIVTGHQPHGDLPFPIRLDSPQEGSPPCFILACDTSYSNDVRWISRKDIGKDITGTTPEPSPHGNRGFAVSEVLMTQCRSTFQVSSVYSHGILSDGTAYQGCNLVSTDTGGAGLPVRLVPDVDVKAAAAVVAEQEGPPLQWWIKGILKDGSILCSTGRAYHVWNIRVRPEELVVEDGDGD